MLHEDAQSTVREIPTRENADQADSPDLESQA